MARLALPDEWYTLMLKSSESGIHFAATMLISRRAKKQRAGVRPRLFDSLGYRGLGKLSVISQDYAQSAFGQGQKSWPRRAFGW
jgi:hypothetical protein